MNDDALTDADWTAPVGYRHPRQTKDLALQLWGLRCSRDAQCVERELRRQAVDLGIAYVPDARTIRAWAVADDWSGEIARMLRSIAPDVVGSLVTDLIMGASEGMPWLRDVLAGRVEKPNTARVRAILTALSMCSVPDLAQAAVKESVSLPAQADTPAIPAQSPTDMGSWKRQLSARLDLADTD